MGMKTVEELERELAREVRRFIDLAIEAGHSLEEAKGMAPHPRRD